MSHNPKKSQVFYKFDKLTFMQKEKLAEAVDDMQFTLYAFLLLFDQNEIKELRTYISDEKYFRGDFF